MNPALPSLSARNMHSHGCACCSPNKALQASRFGNYPYTPAVPLTYPMPYTPDVFSQSAQNIGQIAQQSQYSSDAFIAQSQQNIKNYMVAAMQANLPPQNIALDALKLYTEQQGAVNLAQKASNIMQATATDIHAMNAARQSPYLSAMPAYPPRY